MLQRLFHTFTLLKKRLKETDWNTWYPLFFTIAFILILFQYRFSTFDSIFYDLWQRMNLFSRQVDELVLVTQNEESDQFLGESYNYSYATHYKVVQKILEQEPKAIVYFLNFSLPESLAEEQFYQKFYELLKQYQNSGGIVRFQSEFTLWGVSQPPDPLAHLGYSFSVVNVDSEDFARDGVSRKTVLSISGNEALQLWLANQFRLSRGQEALSSSAIKGAYYNINADAYFSYFVYPQNPLPSSQSFLEAPIHRVAQGSIPEKIFKDKIVLIGTKYMSNSDDFVLTPFSKVQKAPKINLSASIIASLIRGKTIVEVPVWLSQVLALLIAIFLSFVVSRVHPSKGLSITIIIIFSCLILAYISTVALGYWPKIAHVILSIFVVYYIWVPFRAIAEHQSRFAIEEEAKLLKKVDHLKQNFISLMSHDLKTPVAKITGIVDLLKMKLKSHSEHDRLLQDMSVATSDLNNFINSILDLTKVESQNLKLNLVSKDLNQIVEQVLETLKFEAEEKQMKLVQKLSPLYPIQIDPLLAKRIISNLVGNAIKYAGQGKTIEITSWDDEQWVYVQISDNGAGISPEDQKHIFDKFYRVKNDQSHSIRGSGLGLYLVKYFIELLGGKISLQSKLGEGSTFLVQFRNA